MTTCSHFLHLAQGILTMAFFTFIVSLWKEVPSYTGRGIFIGYLPGYTLSLEHKSHEDYMVSHLQRTFKSGLWKHRELMFFFLYSLHYLTYSFLFIKVTLLLFTPCNNNYDDKKGSFYWQYWFWVNRTKALRLFRTMNL